MSDFETTVKNLVKMKPKPHDEDSGPSKSQSPEDEQSSSKRATRSRNSGEDCVSPPIGEALAFCALDDQGVALTAEQAETMRAKLAAVQEAAPVDWSKLVSRPGPIWPDPYVTCGDPPGSISRTIA